MLFAQKFGVAAALCLTLTFGGCAENPGSWPKDKVAEYVQESLLREGLEVSQVALTSRGNGVYEGTGTVQGGETLDLTVTQDATARRLSWSAKGDRGSFIDGSYELK